MEGQEQFQTLPLFLLWSCASLDFVKKIPVYLSWKQWASMSCEHILPFFNEKPVSLSKGGLVNNNISI